MAGPAAGAPVGRPSRDTEGRSRSSAVHSSQGRRSLSGHLKAIMKLFKQKKIKRKMKKTGLNNLDKLGPKRLRYSPPSEKSNIC